MRLLNAIKGDMLFQFKHGFYIIYAVLTIFYIIILSYIPQGLARIVTPLILLSDPSVVGFFFIGGIMMLEKTQGVLDYILITPLHLIEYLSAKIISLTLIALISSVTIAYGSGQSFHPIVLIPSIILISTFFTLLGFIVALQCETINQYFIKMIPSILILIIPCFLILSIHDFWIIKLIPSVTSLFLVLGAFHGILLWEFIYYAITLIVFIILCLLYITKHIYKILYGGK